MCSMFGVLMFEVFDVRYFGVRSKTNKNTQVNILFSHPLHMYVW